MSTAWKEETFLLYLLERKPPPTPSLLNSVVSTLRLAPDFYMQPVLKMASQAAHNSQSGPKPHDLLDVAAHKTA